MPYRVIGLCYNGKKYNTVPPNTIQCNTWLSNAASIQKHVGEYKGTWHIYSLQHACNYPTSLQAAASQTEVRKDCFKVPTPEMKLTWCCSVKYLIDPVDLVLHLSDACKAEPDTAQWPPFLHDIFRQSFSFTGVLVGFKTLFQGIHQPWPLCKPYEFRAQLITTCDIGD